MKICFICKENKDFIEFNRQEKMADGHFSYCKDCANERRKRWRAEHPAQYLKQIESWAKSEKYKLWNTLNMKKIADKRNFNGMRELVIERDGGRCTVCNLTRKEHSMKYGRDITVDHIRGRVSNELSNLQTLCLECHGRKDVLRRWNDHIEVEV